MKMKLTNTWKKRLLGLATLMIGLAVMATGTAANFVAEKKAESAITTGMLRMELVEETATGRPWPDNSLGEALPGVTLDRIVKVRNSGSVPFFCKISMAGEVTAFDGGELPFEPVSMDLNTEQWIEKGDVYYYHRILYPGETTEPLFTQVTFSPEMGNEYMRAKVNLQVLAQAVQSDNNGTDPLEALGWSDAGKVVIKLVEEMAEPAAEEERKEGERT